ncbi:CaiB/BaiF CoA transferase family protein [Rhodoflexus caldus]|uniref:CaiB/BaiF CoA transferase family protein n=1 Tax=Rhodoflexus caldus TaxID=2891236 RepID=UPI002029CA92|nr:CaiB/BaiF CoA-transferase family protein [Rhodoflexus caldus]
MLPLQGLKVLEFTHAVMGPACGLLLADMGAEVIHIEPPEGDATRRLKGFGTGYFPYYSRNKKSLAIDLKSAEGKEIIYKLAKQADIVVENFGPGTMERLGYGYQALRPLNERLIYCSLKGFLSGPYEKRHAMDEVVQMMGGLAYMTGPPGMPLRAGTSVIDITGGMFGLIGILAALYERERTGKGKFVKGALFETTAFLMGQHMAYGAITKVPVPPMPARVSAWSVYRTFQTADGEQVFIGIISDKHWEKFCRAFGKDEWATDPRLQTNNGRIDEREWLLPAIEQLMASLTKADIISRCEAAEIPFAPIARPEDLFDDPQLNHGNSLLQTTLPDGTVAKLPNVPLEYGDTHFELRNNPPAIGEHTAELLQSLGYSEEQIAEWRNKGLIASL